MAQSSLNLPADSRGNDYNRPGIGLMMTRFGRIAESLGEQTITLFNNQKEWDRLWLRSLLNCLRRSSRAGVSTLLFLTSLPFDLKTLFSGRKPCFVYYPLWASCLLPAQYVYALSADDFMPPIQAQTKEKSDELRAVTGPVETTTVEGFAGDAVKAQSMQGAFNAAVQQRSAGSFSYHFQAADLGSDRRCSLIRFQANATFTRRSRRLAYVKALAQAEKHLSIIIWR